jgi:hypothetical protein
MVERILYDVVGAGLDWYRADAARFERFLLNDLRLDADEAARARGYFEGDATADPVVDPRPPTLIHGFARTGGPFPCIALVLGRERIAQDYLGRDAPMLDSDEEKFQDPETGAWIDPKARRMAYTFQFHVYAGHPDVTVYYYQLLKKVIMSQLDVLEDNDVEDLEFEGNDLAPDPRYLPSDVFGRMLSVTVNGDELWAEEIEGGYGTQVDGLHVADGLAEDDDAGIEDGSPSKSVTPYVES